MRLYSFRGSLIFIILFWISGSGECLSPKYVNSQQFKQFTIYKRCMEKYLVPTWKLLGPAYNGSFYVTLNFRFNQLFEKAHPIAIVTPTETRDVQAAVKCGVKTSIPLVPISGGHSYAGLSIGSNHSIVIDFCYMNAITINRKKQTVTAESGTLIGQLYGTLWEHGKLGSALGICATVAIGGLVLGGGIGYFSALYGLVIDNLLEINMVDARGNSVQVDRNHNVDLWWAMRGIGSGYIGLVTSVKLKAFRADELELIFVQMKYHNRSFKTVMGSYIKWLDWTKKNDPSIASVIAIRGDDYNNPYDSVWPGIEVQLLQVKDPRIKWTGNPAFLNASRHIFPKPIEYNVTYPSFGEFVVTNNHTVEYGNMEKWIPDTIKSKFDYLSSITKDKARPRHFYAKSFYVKKRYRAEHLLLAEKVLLEIPNDSCGIWINSEQGAVARHQSNESSYVHRDVLFNFKIYHNGNNVDHIAPSQKWIKKFYKSVHFLDSGETYQNYPERGLRNHLHRYYGSNLKRLIEIKRKWDPDGYFNSEQSIPIH
ncbi:uncharacterized FAD-linked oxidoreductase YgaK-like [Bradysia coprophila]|uniref:uncharacterized FAD-linked oxidoreductase YgaK-like n=1 Tax=Bradysia coprophila TaxID=38358 RepID=UPI00187D78B1|nr:uncharacterized FAD-linked oxidoreductase YgaK-like [Bradysia coprophila]